MTRSRLFLLAATTALLVLLAAATRCEAPGDPPAEGDAQPVTLMIATDLHYISPALTDHGAYFQKVVQNGDGKAMKYCEELTDAFVRQTIARRPDALILSGDLTFNGAKLSHTGLAEKLRLIEDAGIPVLVIPGNHDLQNTMAASFEGDAFSHVESVTPQEFEQIYRPFGFEEALSRDSASLSYIAELTPTLRVLMLDVNTVYYTGAVKTDTLQWVQQQLESAQRQRARVLAVSHQNLLEHHRMFSYGFVIGNSASLLALYEQYGVLCNLSGHMHIQHIARSESGLPDIATSSLIIAPNQAGLLTLQGASAQYHTVPIDVPLPESSGVSSMRDYAHGFLWDIAYRQGIQLAGDSPEADRLARSFADINCAFFAGRMDAFPWDESVLAQWQETSAFARSYLQSLADDGFQNYTEFSFPLK